MKLADKKTSAIIVGFILFLVVFAYALLTYTRRVDGVSMLPTLEEGDLVVIQRPVMADLHVGDIIVYDSPCSASGFSVIHRIVGNQSGGFITKGDNNPATDQISGIASFPITDSCIEGRVVFVIPYIERLASLPDGLNYVLAFLIVLAVVFYELWGGSEKSEETRKTVIPT